MLLEIEAAAFARTKKLRGYNICSQLFRALKDRIGAMEPQQIVLLEGGPDSVVAHHHAHGDVEGVFFMGPDGSILYRNQFDPEGSWMVNRTVEAFRKAAIAFNRYCAGDGRPRSEAEFLRDAERLKMELSEIERTDNSELSFWDAILEDIDAGNL